MTKKTQGRKKIEIKKIEKLSNRQVTFSKRRVGLFKKASELCVLTGVKIAIIVQSIGNKIFSFAYPSVDAVVDRFLHEDGSDNVPAIHDTSCNPHNFNKELSNVFQELKAERKRMKLIEESKIVEDYGVPRENIWWWDESVDEMGLDELEQYGATLDELLKNVTTRADELQNSSSLVSIPDKILASTEMMFHNSNMEIEPTLTNNHFDWESFFNFENELP